MEITLSGLAMALSLTVAAGSASASLDPTVAPGGASPQELPSWQVVRTSRQCILIQRLKAPEPALVTFESVAGSDSFSIMISIAKMTKHPTTPVAAEIGLGGANKAIKATALPGQMDGPLRDLLRFEFIAPEDFAPAARATALQITYAGTKVGPFPLPDAAVGVEALLACLAAQLTGQGADPAQFRPGGALPVPLKSRRNFLTVEQMRSAIAAGTAPGAPADFKLTIDTQGTISGCLRSRPAASEKVEKAVCDLLAGQTLFKPARDPAGQAVVGAATYDLQLSYSKRM